MPPTNELLNNRRCRPAMDESAPIVRSPLERDHASPHVAPPIPSQHFPRCCRVADKLPPRTSVIGVYRDLATASASKRLSGREGIFQQFLPARHLYRLARDWRLLQRSGEGADTFE